MPNSVKIAPDWGEVLSDEFEKTYFKHLTDFVRNQYENQVIYPPGRLIFRAFDSCPFEKTKVVIMGQDPYHGHGQANGLCFSVGEEVKMPPSLVNIFKEVLADTGHGFPENGDLGRWAEQGVLLLNATLTVRQNSPGSHQNKGWEEFTNRVIMEVSSRKNNIVFMLWGSYAQKKADIIDIHKHLVLKAAHPSPFSVFKGFFGCKHFSKANEYLKQFDLEPIKW